MPRRHVRRPAVASPEWFGPQSDMILCRVVRGLLPLADHLLLEAMGAEICPAHPAVLPDGPRDTSEVCSWAQDLVPTSTAMLPSIETPCIRRRSGQSCYAPALVRYVALTVRRGAHNIRCHTLEEQRSLSTKAIPNPLFACERGPANAGPTAIISVGRLESDCR
jgi:hypothetical protein